MNAVNLVTPLFRYLKEAQRLVETCRQEQGSIRVGTGMKVDRLHYSMIWIALVGIGTALRG